MVRGVVGVDPVQVMVLHKVEVHELVQEDDDTNVTTDLLTVRLLSSPCTLPFICLSSLPTATRLESH